MENKASKQKLAEFFSSRKKKLSSREYIDGILAGQRHILSKAITLIESNREEKKKQGREVLQGCLRGCLSATGNSIRIGITGAPGVGKSSFLEAFGSFLVSQGEKIAVLAIDPSSQISGGSIMGDKIRMSQLAQSPHAFIRPSPSGNELGGVAQKTRETILLCEAAGFKTIFVETVGVGQAEFAVHSMVDYFLLLVLANSGDEIQSIKRGIMEMADAIALTKADSFAKVELETALTSFKNVLGLFPSKENNWQIPVFACSALKKEGLEPIWKSILDFYKSMQHNRQLQEKRKRQSRYWLQEIIIRQLKKDFYSNNKVQQHMPELEKQLLKGEILPIDAAEKLFALYRH